MINDEMERRKLLTRLIVAVLTIASGFKCDTSPTGDPGDSAVLPNADREADTVAWGSEVTLASPAVPLRLIIHLKGVNKEGWIHLEAGDGSEATFLVSISDDLDPKEVRGEVTEATPIHGFPRLLKVTELVTEGDGGNEIYDIESTQPTFVNKDCDPPLFEHQVNDMLPFGHKDNDVKSLEHQRNNKLSSGYQRNDLSFGHQENDKIPSEHQNNMISSREERSDLLPDKLPGSSQTIRDTGPRLSSAEVCPNLTRLLSPNNDPDLIPPSYDLECKMTPPGAMYTLTYIYETPGRYHLVAYYKERTSGTTLWRREVQVEVQVLQVVLGPSAVLTLLHGSVTAHAHLSLTPATAHSLCPRGHISWAWDFGEELAEKQREEMMFGKTGRKMGDGEITGEMTGDDERVENLRDEDELLKKGSGEYEDYVVLLEKVTEENRKQVERRRSRRDARFIHRREMAKTVKGKGSDILAEGKEQQVATSEALTTPSYLEDIVTGDNEASSAGGDNESSRAGSDEEDSSAGGDDEESNAVGDDEDSSSGGEEEGSSTDFHYGIPSATLPIVITTSNSDTVSSSNPSLSPTTAPSINCHTSTTTTTKPPLSHTATTTLSTFYSTITSTSSSASTIRDINTKSSPSTTVYHNYHQPGTYDFSAQVKCNSLGLFKKKIDNAFLVVLPIGDVEISSSRTVVVLEQVTEPVTVTVRVSEGSHLQPLTLDLADGTILHIPPKFLAENGNWVAQVEHVYSSEGDYLPRVHVVNPVSWRNTSIPRPIRVQHLPSSVFLWPENYLGAVGEVVTFHAHALGTDLHYDWLLPGGEHLHDSGPAVSRVYVTNLDDLINVTVYNDAHDALYPPRPRPEAVGLVRIEEKLESAILLVDNKSTDVVIQKDKRTPLEVVVTPPGALSNAEFFWYGEGGGSPVESHYHTRHKYFESTGEWVLYVEVINSISQVRSNNVSVLVVERISGVRGLADHDSVIKGKPRNYTVLVDKGSHITYTWDFEAGWLRKVNTTKPTKEHTFHNSGTYTITITLTSPLREAFVVTSKVFVLDSGICDTPKVLQFWPKDIAAPRQYDASQEILVEPELRRLCPLSSGPEYRWRLWNQQQVELHLEDAVELHSPTLLIYPFYDQSYVAWNDQFMQQQQQQQHVLEKLKDQNPRHDIYKLLQEQEGGSDLSKVSPESPRKGSIPLEASLSPTEVTSNSADLRAGQDRGHTSSLGDPRREPLPPGVPESFLGQHKSLEDGEYIAELTIKETDTLVQAAFNTTFSVVAIRLKAVFLDGTERELEATSNITLRVEVAAPTPNYTLNWMCRLSDNPDYPCFSEPDPWASFPTTTHHADGFFVRIKHLLDILSHAEDDHDDGRDTSSVGTTSTIQGVSDVGTETFWRYRTSSVSPADITLPSGKASADTSHTASTSRLTAPPKSSGLLSSNVRYIETISFPASMLLPGHKFVFIASCHHGSMTTSAQQMIVVAAPRDSVGISSHLGSQFPFGAARRLVFESECMSCSPEELASLQYSWELKLLREGGVNDATVSSDASSKNSRELALLGALRQGHTELGFLPRPRDYLRVYNVTVMRESVNDSVERVESVSPYLSSRDLQKLPGPVTQEMLEEAQKIERRWQDALHFSYRKKTSHTGRRSDGRQKRSVRQDASTTPSASRENTPPLSQPSVKMMGSGNRHEREDVSGRTEIVENWGGDGRALGLARLTSDAYQEARAMTLKKGGSHEVDSLEPSSVTSAKHRHPLRHSSVTDALLGQFSRRESDEHRVKLDVMEYVAGGRTNTGTVPDSHYNTRDPPLKESARDSPLEESTRDPPLEESTRNPPLEESTRDPLLKESTRGTLLQVDADATLTQLRFRAKMVNSGNSVKKIELQEIFSGNHKVDDDDTRWEYTGEDEPARSLGNGQEEEKQGQGQEEEEEEKQEQGQEEDIEMAGKVLRDFAQLNLDGVIPVTNSRNDFESKVHRDEVKDARIVRGYDRVKLQQTKEGDGGGGRDHQLSGNKRGKKRRQVDVLGGSRREAGVVAGVMSEATLVKVSLADTSTNSQRTQRRALLTDNTLPENLRRSGVKEVRVEVGETPHPRVAPAVTADFLHYSNVGKPTGETSGVGVAEAAPGKAVTPLNPLIPPTPRRAHARTRRLPRGEAAERAGQTTSDAATGASPPTSPTLPPAPPLLPSPAPPLLPSPVSADASSFKAPSLQVVKEGGRFSSVIDDHSGREDEWSDLSSPRLLLREMEEEKEQEEDTDEEERDEEKEESKDRRKLEKIMPKSEEKTLLKMKLNPETLLRNDRERKDKGIIEKSRLEVTQNKKKLEGIDKAAQTDNMAGVTTLNHGREETRYTHTDLTSRTSVQGGKKQRTNTKVERNDTGGEGEKDDTGSEGDKDDSSEGERNDTGDEKDEDDTGGEGERTDTSGEGEEEDDEVEAVQVSHQSVHQQDDSAHLPVRDAQPNLAPDGGAPIRHSDQFVPRRGSGPGGAQRKTSTRRPKNSKVYPTASPSGVFDYQQYKKLGRRKISPSLSSESGRSIGNTARRAGRNGGDRVRAASSGAHYSRSGDGMAANHTTQDGMGGPRHISERARGKSQFEPSERLPTRREDELRQLVRGKGADSTLWLQEREHRQQKKVTEVDRMPSPYFASTPRRRPPLSMITEGQREPIRGSGYQTELKNYVETHQDVPNFSCRSEHWEECAKTRPGGQVQDVLNNTLGESSKDNSVMNTNLVREPFVTERFQTDVFLFKELTSTGTHESVLVLYTDYLNKEARYLLHLNTYNPITNNTGLAIQLIEFSPAPNVENCRITPLANRKGSWFRGSCDEVRGQYYPVLLEWSYSFLWPDKTVFYYGARTSIDFSLPSGLEANDYKVYVSIKAIDGKGVSYKYPVVMDFVVYPRSTTGDGILSIFQEISTIQNESPSLLLQQVRTLAWELNLLHSSDVTQTVFDNILTILFYRTSCKDSLVAADDPSYSSKYSSQNNGDFFVKVNLLKSCARDHLAEIVVELPVRIEMEVLQVLTALQIIADALEYISSITYSRIIVAMQTVATRLWCTYNAEVKTEAAQQYFVLSSVMLDKQFEIYDWNETSAHLSNTVISLLLDVMKTEIAARFLEEEPLTWSTDTLKFHGFLAEAQKINKWNRSVSFSFEPNSIPDGVHLVQSLVHSRSPYNVTNDLVTSQVVNVDLHVPSKFLRQVKVKVQRSQLLLGDEYDFRRPGYLTPQTLSVYEFVVAAEHDSLVLHILLQITKVLNSEYPVAALLLICNSMQSLKEPVYKVELTATDEPSQVSLLVPPHQLTHGKKLLIIMDKNSYENNWARYNSSEIGADFLVSGWWSQCLVWGDNQWHAQNCSVLGKESSWDYTSCSCKSYYSVYGAQAIPILDEESKVNVNELMLRETYLALYFMVLLLVVYFMLALALQTSDRHRLRRRNIWLRDNKPEHEWAYLLTIKTGTQWNAGTTARVYAILHGTHGMSETRELQSKQTGQLFTRGALCTFILTTAEPLGDILKVQLWHDNSGSDSGWYVCETSVGDLVLGARYAYPCYRWLSVQAEDAKVEREITLESPTTFLQDFEHFLPQYASEHMLWTSLLTTSSTAKLFRLQRLTICLIVCLCMGTVSLGVVQKINTEHTMMVPDMHIESLYYGGIIALLLLPVQWLLEMAFKMSNRLEEKEYNAKAVLDTLRASKEMSPPATSDRNQNGQDDGEDPAHDIYDTNAKIWRNLVNWAQTTELSNLNGELHSALFQGQDNMQVTQRARSEADHDLGSAELMSNTHETPTTTTLPANITRIINHQHEVTNTKKCSPTILSFFSELRKTFNYILHFVAKNRRSKSKKRNKLEEDGWDAEEDVDDDDDDDDLESDELGVTSSITFIFSQCVGWIVCCFFAALCCMVLFVRGSGMPMDYGSLWIHIIYITLCFSVFIMQPLVVVIYTLYKVCMYRWLGCRGCISSCVTIPLDQVVAIWNRYQAVLLEQVHSANIMDSEKLLEERQRTRELRYSHPPSEDYLLKCREKEMRKENVSSLFCNSIGHLLLLTLLIIIASSVNVEERYRLNWSIYSSLENGSCLESARFVDACKSIGSNSDSCNQQKDKTYMGFKDIKSKEDWWKWAYSELLALTYNSDKTFSQYNIFCDSNSIIIGMPRIRKYDIGSEECDASKVKISNNRSMADLLRVKTCFPNYVDEVAHLFSFKSTKDKEYEWDAHFLAITYGQYGHYSYTSYKQSLATSRFSSLLMLMVLQSSNWIDENTTRAVVTDFALYHPQTQLYTAVTLLAEFPSLSGVKVKTSVWSTHIERYSGMLWSVCMLAEIILLAVAMHYLNKAVIYIHTCRFRIWKSFWGILDIFMTIVSWSYIVCLMLRVDIAEDALWQLRVAYFQKFVNLKGLTTWDNILHALIGIMLMLHLLRCLCLMQYLPRLRYLGLMLATATKDVSVISIALGILVMACMLLGHMWFSPVLWEFHTLMQTLLTLFRMTWLRLDFLKSVEHESRYTKFLGYLFYLIIYVFLYQVARALFASAFLNVRKSHVYKPGLDVKWEDLVYYVKERSRSVLQMFFRKKEDDKDQPEDNTPPDFYMTELDLQITQVMAGLENVGETLGLVVNRIDELMEEDEPGVDTWDDYGILKDMHTDDAVWQPEQNKSCTQKTEPEAILKLLHNRVGADSRKQSLMSQVLSLEGRLENMKGEEGDTNTTPIKPLFNLDAFTDIASCQTEIEALTRNWNMTAFEQTEYRTQDDGGRLAKFLKDVSAASDENVTSFGKYGKTVGKLKVNPKLQPSDESLRTVHNRYNPSSTLETRRIGHMQSLVTSQHRMLATESQHHGTHAFQTDTPAQGPIGISSRLCRTQTQGRGKGHVDVLDIVSLESDSESDSSS